MSKKTTYKPILEYVLSLLELHPELWEEKQTNNSDFWECEKANVKITGWWRELYVSGIHVKRLSTKWFSVDRKIIKALEKLEEEKALKEKAQAFQDSVQKYESFLEPVNTGFKFKEGQIWMNREGSLHTIEKVELFRSLAFPILDTAGTRYAVDGEYLYKGQKDDRDLVKRIA